MGSICARVIPYHRPRWGKGEKGLVKKESGGGENMSHRHRR